MVGCATVDAAVDVCKTPAMKTYSTWVCGFVGLWVCGFVGLWVCGCVGVWVCGFVGLWVCGFVGLWVRVDVTTEPQN